MLDSIRSSGISTITSRAGFRSLVGPAPPFPARAPGGGSAADPLIVGFGRPPNPGHPTRETAGLHELRLLRLLGRDRRASVHSECAP